MKPMLQKLDEISLYSATAGNLGMVLGGSIIASLFVIPLKIITSLLWQLSPSLDHLFWFLFLAASCFAIYKALMHYNGYERNFIVLDSVVGMSIAFAGISLGFDQTRLFMFGFVLFHVLRFCKPLFLLNKHIAQLYSLPHVLGFLAGPVMYGIIVNCILRMALWYLSQA